MTSVTWSPRAIRDIESIRAFIAQDSPAYAEFEARRIVAAVERLHLFPESGRTVPERRDAAIREVVAARIGLSTDYATVWRRSSRSFVRPASFQTTSNSSCTSACRQRPER